MSEPAYPYSPSLFDAEYYGGGARGGFPVYRYDDPDQQHQLQMKWDYCHWLGPLVSVLFVGCATGFEVCYFRSRGVEANGVDISPWAVEHAEESAKPYVKLYDGWNLEAVGYPAESIDAIAAFDVLTLVPDDMLRRLCAEIVAAARRFILIRTITKNWRNISEEWDGDDGVTFRYLPFHSWDRLFTESGKFRFDQGHVNLRYEGIYVWSRTS